MNEYEYRCTRCGKCCKAGLEISIREEEVSNWIQAGKHDFSQHVQIDPKSISPEGLAGYHFEEENALLKLLEVHDEKQYEEKKKELQTFILENHIYYGKDNIPLPIYTFMPELGRMPIIIPKSLQVILKGIKWGIAYILKYKSNRCCPFQDNDLCSIQDIKPNDCNRFPYEKDGTLKTDPFFLKMCKGLKKKD